MDAQNFRAALCTLGETQRSFAARIGVGRRTVQTWFVDGPPDHVAFLVRMMLNVRRSSPARPGEAGIGVSCSAALAGPLDALIEAAEEVGWSRDAAIVAVSEWLAAHRR